MKVKLLLVGKSVEDWLQSGLRLYTSRLKHYVPFEMTVIPELKQTSALSVEQIKEREGNLILVGLKSSDEVILLDERGQMFSSEGWARHLEQKMTYGSKDLVFVVGGAYGFSEKVYQRADGKLSLSQMTFSHQMVRLIFVEQLYRAFTIIKGEPYHHK
ncbi:MAG: 23S rRNA (pseudouridine(1915)-N(3))-methyltransferase RlmH [Bacteroidales bacterium]|jgi:23S rRNA (pseudouridine1915-N3)-methyltransferase|nr:23S rRNA (pseudouridine(1915)-N(3))-methyltransferase RlmH [Bacteroidales bacterium]HPH54128.1 23S rRNA (pseudouridine(1915)-N(3))-methyltransferase RlmH [Bacteroidales bacterium]